MSLKKFKAEIRLRDGRKLIIKEAEPGEAKELIRYIGTVGGESDFLTFGAGEYKISLEQEIKLIHGSIESDNQVILVGWVQNVIVGCVTFHAGKWKRVRHTGEFGVSVSKKSWGLGIGTLLTEALLNWAKGSETVRKINLRVRSDNDRAIAVYKKLGFVEEGKITREYYIDGEFINCMV
jgi:RimJ/RimL family protein N-acetyltransferase